MIKKKQEKSVFRQYLIVWKGGSISAPWHANHAMQTQQMYLEGKFGIQIQTFPH